MKKRILSGVLLGGLSVAAIIVGGHFFLLIISALAAIALYEFYNAFRKKGFNPAMPVGFMFFLIMPAFFFKCFEIAPFSVKLSGDPDGFNFYALLQMLVFLALACLAVIKHEKYSIPDVIVTLFGGYYVVAGFSFIPLLYFIKTEECDTFGKYLFFTALLGCVAADTLALFAGMKFGKKKLIPKISPNKTVAGSIGALAGGTVFSLAAGIVFTATGIFTQLPIYHYLIIGLIAGVFSQFGDLFASAIKRYAGIKDYGNLIPGHGGSLDRCDAYIVVMPIVYFYITVFAL